MKHPRAWLREGHWRKLRRGSTWVRPTVVRAVEGAPTMWLPCGKVKPVEDALAHFIRCERCGQWYDYQRKAEANGPGVPRRWWNYGWQPAGE